MDREKITYRRADINDLETLVEFRVRFLNELCKHEDDEETEILRNELRDYFKKALPAEEFIAWLAECDGKTVGTSGMVITRQPSGYWIPGVKVYLLNFYTVPEARKNGICTRLLEEIMNEVRDRGLSYIHLHATDDGINIYRKAGFQDMEHVELKMNI